MTAQTEEPECPECGLNCYPECGQHPAGCLFSGIVYGEWAIAPKCKLKEHKNVAKAKARAMLSAMPSWNVPDGLAKIRVLKYPSDVA